MTRSVTTTDALVLSPYGWPASPTDAAGVLDAFARVATGLQEDDLSMARVEEGLFVAHGSAKRELFRAIPLLRDGFTLPEVLPDAWQGRVTRELVAAYFRPEWRYAPREASWGAHHTHAAVRRVAGVLEVELANAATRPFVDPLRATAHPDDERHVPLSVRLVGAWEAL